MSYLGFSVAANKNTMTKKQVEERVYSSYTSGDGSSLEEVRQEEVRQELTQKPRVVLLSGAQDSGSDMAPPTVGWASSINH